MSTITGAQLEAVMDNIAKEKIILDTAIGTETTAASILKGMQDNIDRIETYDEDVIADLHRVFVNEKEHMPNLKLALLHGAIAALEKHLRRMEGVGVSDYCEAENANRIAPEYAQLARAKGQYMKPIVVFPPVTAMGSFVASGATAGTFTDGSLIDGNKYGPGTLEVECTALGNGTIDLTVTITGTDQNGSIITGTATFSGGSVGTKMEITPDQAGAQFQDVTNATVTGATSADAFNVQSKVDRAVSL